MATSPKDSRFPVPPDPNYSDVGGATQGDFPVDILGRRASAPRMTERGRLRPGRLTDDGWPIGIERGLEEILDHASETPNERACRILRPMVKSLIYAINHRREDPDRLANVVALWAAQGNPDLPPEWNAKWRAINLWFIQELIAKVERWQKTRKGTPSERRERLKMAILALPTGTSGREAERLLRAQGWKVSEATIRRIRSDL